MSNAYLGRENDSLFVFQNNYFYTIGVITMGFSLANSVIICLIGCNYLKLIKNHYVLCVYAFTLVYVSLLLGFLSLFFVPTSGLVYILMDLEKGKQKTVSNEVRNTNIVSEDIHSLDENNTYENDTSDEEIVKKTNPNDTSDEETSDEEGKKEIKKVDLGETSDEEEIIEDEKNGQNCRGCGCFVLDGAECVLPDSSKAYCSGCFESLEQPEEKNEDEEKKEMEEVKPIEECNKTIEECLNTTCEQKCNKKRKIENNCSIDCCDK